VDRSAQQEFDREIVRIAILEAPGAVLLGLGLYGRFEADGKAFIDILNNPDVVNGMLVAGAAIMAWGSWRVIRLVLARARAGGERRRDPRFDE
jgi:hypothetical protein